MRAASSSHWPPRSPSHRVRPPPPTLRPTSTTPVRGVILRSSGGARRDVARLLLSTERPVYLALLLLAGAAWSPGSADLLFIAQLLVLLRGGARLRGRAIARGPPSCPALLRRAGAPWSPGSADLLFIAPLFVLIRVGARFLGGAIAGGY